MTPLVIAHRARCGGAPENSLAGIRAAPGDGAGAVEVDVRRSRDGVPVLLHDRVPLRGAGCPVPVRWLPARLVTRLRLRGGGGERVPTLAAALEAAPAGLIVALDVKDPRAAGPTLDVVRSVDTGGRVLLWSEHAEAVARMAESFPDVECALLRRAGDPAPVGAFCDRARHVGARAVSAHEHELTAEAVGEVHARDLRLYGFLASLAEHAEKLRLDLDGVVTPWPSRARELLDGRS